MSEPAYVALLIEDEQKIRHFVRNALESEGWHVFEADTLQRGLIESKQRRPDLIILDLGLPDGNGVDFIRHTRSWSAIPIVVLSARVEETDKIEALDVGADDYLIKPFGVGELLARVRAALRRQRHAAGDLDGITEFGDVKVDLNRRLVTKADQPVHLTPTEFRLLSTLIANAGRVVSIPQLLLKVWGPSHTDSSHYLHIYMGHLRQKLENDPAQPRFLQTETAVGYRLVLTS